MSRLDRIKNIYLCSLASAYEEVSAREAPRAVHLALVLTSAPAEAVPGNRKMMIAYVKDLFAVGVYYSTSSVLFSRARNTEYDFDMEPPLDSLLQLAAGGTPQQPLK